MNSKKSFHDFYRSFTRNLSTDMTWRFAGIFFFWNSPEDSSEIQSWNRYQSAFWDFPVFFSGFLRVVTRILNRIPSEISEKRFHEVYSMAEELRRNFQSFPRCNSRVLELWRRSFIFNVFPKFLQGLILVSFPRKLSHSSSQDLCETPVEVHNFEIYDLFTQRISRDISWKFLAGFFHGVSRNSSQWCPRFVPQFL